MIEMEARSISINPAYDNAFPKLAKKEFDSLTNSIKEKGLREPIIINDQGIILDGHHRFRACQALGISISSDQFLIKKFENILEEQLYVNEVNLLRRHLNDVQRSEQVSKLKPIYEELAKLNMSKGGKGVRIRTPIGRTNKQLADRANVKLTKFNQIEYVLDHASDEVKEKLRNGTIKPHKAYGRLRNDQFLKKQIAETQLQEKLFAKSTEKISLLEGDFKARCAEFEPNSVSLIFTDPLYDEKHLYLYDGLGEIAMQLLRNGGSLFTYINQSKLFVIGDKLLKAGLTFWWPLYLKMQGNASRMFDRHMEVDIKPLLWFCKGNRPINSSFPKTKNDGKRNYFGDLIISDVPDKRFHDYGQNPKDTEFIMKYLTAPNDLVLDPFVGGGSTAIACMNMKRRFIGIDINPEAIKATKANLRINSAN